MPLISIITINYNNKIGLSKTIHSVLKQDVADIEYIVIDGGSTDGSVALIQEYSHQIDFWVSEKDGGIYAAMNKGWQHASGKFCLFLNSGDYLYENNTIKKIIHGFDDSDILYGDLVLEIGGQFIFQKSLPSYTLFDFIYTSIPHPATFIKRTLLEQQNGFDEEFTIISDWLFFLRGLVEYNIKMKYINDYIAVFELGGVSSSGGNSIEQNKALMKYYPFLLDTFSKLRELRYYQLSRLHQLLKRIISYIKKIIK
jgi:glycosyltransferase involved in cell wall biosynthesis